MIRIMLSVVQVATNEMGVMGELGACRCWMLLGTSSQLQLQTQSVFTILRNYNIAILQYYCLQVHDPELKEQVFRQLQQQLDFIFPDGLVSGSGATAVFWRVSSSGRCILGSGFASCCGSMSPRGM